MSVNTIAQDTAAFSHILPMKMIWYDDDAN
jgi:hypothetical protein